MSATLRHIFLLILLCVASGNALAQIVATEKDDKHIADSIRADFDKRPYFGLYKDNYFLITIDKDVVIRVDKNSVYASAGDVQSNQQA